MAPKKKTEEVNTKVPEIMQHPNLVRSTDIASIIGKSVRWVQSLTQDGVIPVSDPPRGKRSYIYDLVPVLSAYIAMLDKKASAQEQKEAEADLKMRKAEAETALKESQKDLHQLKTDIARGKYVPVEEVELDYKKFFSVFKKFATAIPDRVVGIIGHQVDPVTARQIEQELADDINRMLRTFVVSAVEGDEP